MNPIKEKIPFLLKKVIVYTGHKMNPLLGPYPENTGKRVQMFNFLNSYRIRPWSVTAISGENLIEALKGEDPNEILLDIPAGPSTKLEKVFSIAEKNFIKEEFFEKGGRGCFTCGSAYWISEKRIYPFREMLNDEDKKQKRMIKRTELPLFHGTAIGPLCSFAQLNLGFGFYSDAVKIISEQEECSTLLSGGGSLIPAKGEKSQKVKILARYPHKELTRLGKGREEFTAWENAAIMVNVGAGAALLSMFHPYYDPMDIDVEAFEQNLPDAVTNWRRVREKLSPLDIRMKFILQSMLDQLETRNFD